MDLARRALALLGKRRFVLAVHDVSFPSLPDEDTGRGSPYTAGARAFLRFAAALGFDGIQLGPQGETGPENPSPYDGAAFSRSIGSLALAASGLVEEDALARIVSGVPGGPERAHHRYAWEAHRAALVRSALAAPASFVEAEDAWLAHDVAYERAHGGDARAFVLGQWLLAEQHARLRQDLAGLGLKLYGDLQVGLSARDTWQREDLFLPRHRLGAPPSRTNPDGQPWGYPVFDPRRWLPGAPDRAVVAFVEARMWKLFGDFDGVRIDHPHGFVTPWVYTTDVPTGARLLESPHDPELAPFAIVRPDQIDRSRPAYDDHAVKDLTPAQVDAYATLLDALVHAAKGRGRETSDILCEVLSTCPEPVRLVMERWGLGRFRVTQKSDPHDPRDVYRSENAAPRDWIMMGTHDTPPIQLVIDRWAAAGKLEERVQYLASNRIRVTKRRSLATAMLAELFASPAENVLVFWADLFGERGVYNTPGVFGPDNWVMRIPRDYERVYLERIARGEALDVNGALAAALHARGLDGDLADALEAKATVAT